jgi:hypothetical protein
VIPMVLFDTCNRVVVCVGGPRFASQGNVEVYESLMLIPSLIHHAYKLSDVPKSVHTHRVCWVVCRGTSLHISGECGGG